MQTVPNGLNLDHVRQHLMTIEGVRNAEHVHLWQLDDQMTFFEGHILVTEGVDGSKIKGLIRDALIERFQIDYSTIELKWDKG